MCPLREGADRKVRMAKNATLNTLIGLLRTTRLDLSTEKRAQADIEQVLT
jgi:hypothetical protein